MAVHVYVWLPNLDNLGHASLRVDGGLPGGVVYYSCWYKSEEKKILGKIKVGATLQAMTWGATAAQNTYDEDWSAEGGRDPHAVRLDHLDETAIKKAINEHALANHYQAFFHNCAVHARQVLLAGVPGGWSMSAVSFVMAGGPITVMTPAGLLSFVKSLKVLDLVNS